MEVTEEEKEQLKYILACRKKHRKNMSVLSALLFPLVVGLSFVPGLIFLGILFGTIGLLISFYSVTKTAHVTCPRCGEPFGTNWPIALAVGSNNCQSCDLALVHANSALKSSDKEWLN